MYVYICMWSLFCELGSNILILKYSSRITKQKWEHEENVEGRFARVGKIKKDNV